MNEDTIKPVGDIVLVRVDPPQSKTEGGIILKQDWKSLPPTGTIVAVGGDYSTSKPTHTFQPGDRVIFERYSAVMLGDDLRLCRAENILAVVEDAIQD